MKLRRFKVKATVPGYNKDDIFIQDVDNVYVFTCGSSNAMIHNLNKYTELFEEIDTIDVDVDDLPKYIDVMYTNWERICVNGELTIQEAIEETQNQNIINSEYDSVSLGLYSYIPSEFSLEEGTAQILDRNEKVLWTNKNEQKNDAVLFVEWIIKNKLLENGCKSTKELYEEYKNG